MIAVVGGSGFIGSRFVKRLLESDRKVKIIDKSPSALFPDLVTIADVRDKDGLIPALQDCDTIVNLAAEHRDDVRPPTLYDDVNVEGARNICAAAEELGISRIVFTSSVAVYGFAPVATDETGDIHPFNDYGRTKAAAEEVYREWQGREDSRSLFIVRPTVVFGEENRGNVYNLFRHMSSRRFVMVGRGTNRKSMAYVENVAAFLEYGLGFGSGVWVYNYADEPDLDMNTLVALVDRLQKGRVQRRLHFPYVLGYTAALVFDLVARISGKSLPISSVRVKKFCSDTVFSARKAHEVGFRAPVSLREGIARTIRHEFLEDHDDGVGFDSE